MTRQSSFSSLRAARQSLGMTTTELAHRVGVQQSTVVRLEQSEQRESASLGTLRRIAEALGAQFSYTIEFPKAACIHRKNMKQIRSNKGRKPSRLGEAIANDEFQVLNKLSPQQKLTRALELSDLTRQFQDARYERQATHKSLNSDGI